MVSITTNWVDLALDRTALRSRMTAQGNVYHYSGASILPHEIDRFYYCDCSHDKTDVERATVRGSNASQQLRYIILGQL